MIAAEEEEEYEMDEGESPSAVPLPLSSNRQTADDPQSNLDSPDFPNNSAFIAVNEMPSVSL